MLSTIATHVTYALPDNFAQVTTQIVITLASWWLGRKNGKQSARRQFNRNPHA